MMAEDTAAVEPPQAATAAVPRQRPARLRERDAGRAARRQAPIHAYVGPNGSGKSLAMIHDTLPTLDGVTWRCNNDDHRHMREDYVDPITGEVGPTTTGTRRVLSTVRLLVPETGEEHPLYERLTEWHQVLDAEHCDLLFDEVTGIANSRDHSGMPVQVQTMLDQQRKTDNLVRLTAPAFGRMDKTIRQVAQAITLCKGMFGRSGDGLLWRRNRLFWWKTYDARDMEEFTAARANNPDPRTVQFRPKSHARALMWGPRSRAFNAYDSLGAVSRVGEVLDSGRCAHCGGRRSVPVCRCER